jgi:hypothetical protein
MKKPHATVDGSKRKRRFSTEARLQWYASYRSLRWFKHMQSC